MSKPHPCHETFARDIADCENEVTLNLQQANEIAGNVTHGKDLACEFIRTRVKVTGAAQSSLRLCGFVDRAAQIVVLAR